MAVKGPGLGELAEIARGYGLNLTAQELESFRALMAPSLASYSRLDELVEPAIPIRYPRTFGYRPAPEDNPLGAWYWRCEIKGAPQGPLQGRSFVIKDNVCVAGMPMMNGTRVLEGYVPTVDATVVTRILDAGGTILGKSVCESLCFSGGSHTSDTGPVRNPHDRARSAGGSSSGSAALVASGAVDMAIGGDQGGSIRIPGSWCGVYGLKPTYGLVPYTGAFPVDMTLDHLGPMARSAADCAQFLEVIAGPDGADPRQRPAPEKQAYVKALTGDVKRLRLAIVREGFGWEGVSEQDVDDAVLEAAHSFEQLGARVDTISIPWHRDGMHVWLAIALEGSTATILHGNSMGTGWKGLYNTGLQNSFARGWRASPDQLSETVKLTMLLAGYMHRRYHGLYYGKAQNLVARLAAAYQHALSTHDLLVMPTIPLKATPIPPSGCSREEYLRRAFEMIQNVCPFNLTGNPAMNVPCAMSTGLPVGLMLIGRGGEDATVLRAADAYQRGTGN